MAIKLSRLHGLRLGDPGEVDLTDEFGQGLGLEERTGESFLEACDEDLVERLGREAVYLFAFGLSDHGSGPVKSGEFPLSYRYTPYGTTIVRLRRVQQ